MSSAESQAAEAGSVEQLQTRSSRAQQQQQHGDAPNQRFSNLIHDSEVFLTKLREFKPQSLGCIEARRKSSSTLIFPSPQQACLGPPKCTKYPHNVKPTPGYWIECHGSGARPVQAAASSAGATEVGRHEELGSRGSNVRGSPFSMSSMGGEQHQMTPVLAGERSTGRHDKETDPSTSRDDPGLVHELARRRKSIERLDSSSRAESSMSWAQQQHQKQQRDGSESAAASHHHQQQQQSGSYEPGQSPTRGAGTDQTGSSWVDARPGAQQKTNEQRDARSRLGKRTMTRDDIDLHKSRRAMPNITITEPSFNQSISGSLYSKQQTKSQASARAESTEVPEEGLAGEREQELNQQQHQHQQQQQPIKFQIQRYMSIEAQQSKEDQSDGASKPRDFIIERQESSETEETIPPAASFESAYRPSHAYHRPSIIREDIDNEASETPELVGPQQDQHKHLYCGLSKTVFNKKPYQQSYSEPKSVDQFRDSSLELISFEEENYEKHYYGREHWNYFTNDELLGPVMLSLKQEVNNQRDHFHVLLRTVSYTLHGTIPASTICADRYDREAIVRELSEIAKLKPPLMLGQLPSTPDELLKLDHIFIKTELKVGVIYIKAGQEESEEAILGNRQESALFTEFLDLLGDRITLRGFDRYKGGLDTVHNLTGNESVYTMWRNIEIMFHVSTMLPHEENDPQKLQKKRHIGNDIVCVAFIESDDTLFWPGCIKSYFLHTFIAVQTSPKALKEGEKRKYTVSCVCRNEVQYAFRPYLIEQDEFYKSDYFREWLLVKIINGERASYSAPKFARMQDRTRSQLLEDIITNLANHLVTGQIPKPYRRGSWRPLGHTRASSPLEDSMKDYFEDYDQLAKDFCNAFCGPNKSVLCDVVFRVKDLEGNFKLVHGVRAILAIRSRTFLEMLYGFVPPGTGPTSLQNQTNLRAIEMKALSGESSSSYAPGGKELEQNKNLLTKRGSVGTDSARKSSEKERRQSMLPNLSKSIAQKPNYLTVPSTSSGTGAGSGSGTGGMIKNAFNRLVSGNWSGWSGNIKGYKGEPMHIKVEQNKNKVDLNSLAICKEIAKIDADKLTQREFEIKEFDYETFQQTIEYIHNGQCKLSYETIPGLICAAEHYDLPDLLHACFHHANTHMRLSAAPKMMNALYQNSCFYITAMQLLDSIYEYIDPHGQEFFSRTEYLDLYESVFTTLLSRKTLQISELKKFQAMHGWAREQVRQKRLRKQQLLRKASSADHEKSTSADGGDTMPGQLTFGLAVVTSASSVAVNRSQTLVTTDSQEVMASEEAEIEYKNLMNRLNKEINIKLDKISNEDLVKVVLPTRVFSNDKVFEIMSDESRIDY